MRREQSFVARGLVMHWPSVPASANPLREGQRFVRPSRKDAGCHLVLSGGTDGSNPASSSGESAANSAIGSACGVDNHDPLTRTEGSNPPPSSGESANRRYRDREYVRK
jgi:hypothetical protein